MQGSKLISCTLALPVAALAWMACPGHAPAEERPVINYDEARAGGVPNLNPLLCRNGEKINTKEQWVEKRRPELLKLFEREMYGKVPIGKPAYFRSELVAENRNALGGKATLQRILMTWSVDERLNDVKKPEDLAALKWAEGPMYSELLLYLPNQSKVPVPVFVILNFGGNHSLTNDSSVPLPNEWEWFSNDKEGNYPDNKATEKSRGIGSRNWPLEQIISRGYAVCTAYYGQFQRDDASWSKSWSVPLYTEAAGGTWRAVYAKVPVKQGAWGAISSWAWGLSRMADCLQGVPQVDGKKLIVVGHSRLGKAALWAGAQDERFGIVIGNNSGAGGAALSKRIFGETVAVLNKAFPHWFCDNFNKYSDNEAALPVDQHELIALMAPRPVYIASATEDNWADQKGEFLGGKLAEPVYALFGLKGLGVDEPPAPDKSVGDAIGYHNRTGKHDILLYDWEQYMNFADRHWGKPE